MKHQTCCQVYYKVMEPGDRLSTTLSNPTFDAVHYLNDILPNFTLSPQSAKQNRALSLQNASSDTQSLLAKINTYNVRSSSELTSLTDEILRSGNRLAYEVESLSGDVNNFYETLSEGLKADIDHFVHNEVAGLDFPGSSEQRGKAKEDPAFITQLRTLSQVKARLEAVVAVFGEGMKWPLPPSDQSIANSLVSVSAPELGIQSTDEDDKAREAARVIRAEIQELLDSEGGGQLGLNAATKRVEEYRELATIWKGTTEEKPRARSVETLAKLVEDRRRALESRAQRSKSSDATRRSASAQGRIPKSNTGGLFRNLAKLRDEMYLD